MNNENLEIAASESIDQMTSTPRCEALVDERLEIREATDDYDPEDDWYNDDAVAFLALAYELETDLNFAKSNHNELLYAVACKFPGESRHQTALRYIREREQAVFTGEKCSAGSTERTEAK